MTATTETPALHRVLTVDRTVSSIIVIIIILIYFLAMDLVV